MLNIWYLKFFKNYKKIKKNNFIFYHYEDLIHNPELTLAKILRFIFEEYLYKYTQTKF